MDKYDILVETYGLPYLLGYFNVDDATVLRTLHDEGLVDPDDLTYEDTDQDDLFA